MDANEKTINRFTTRCREMLLSFQQLKAERNALQAQLAEQAVKIKKLQEQLAQAQNDYNSLKMAKMIEVSDTDIQNAEKRLSRLIRDVNKCITLLSDKEA